MARRPPRLLAITDGRQRHAGAFGRWAEALAAAGVDGLQIREKGAADRLVLELAERARTVAPETLRTVVNARADIALAAGIAGVHLPASGVSVRAARSLLGFEGLVGLSTHHPREVERAFDDGADYVTFGPVYPTPSKERYGPPPGLPGLAEAVALGGPVLALGGITMERAAECLEVGAYGVAAIRLFTRPEAVTPLVELMEGAPR